MFYFRDWPLEKEEISKALVNLCHLCKLSHDVALTYKIPIRCSTELRAKLLPIGGLNHQHFGMFAIPFPLSAVVYPLLPASSNRRIALNRISTDGSDRWLNFFNQPFWFRSSDLSQILTSAHNVHEFYSKILLQET